MRMGTHNGIGTFRYKPAGEPLLSGRMSQSILDSPMRKCDDEIGFALLCPGQRLRDVGSVRQIHFRPDAGLRRIVGPVCEIQQGNPYPSDIDNKRISACIVLRISAYASVSDGSRGLQTVVNVEGPVNAGVAFVQDMVVGCQKDIGPASVYISGIFIRAENAG